MASTSSGPGGRGGLDQFLGMKRRSPLVRRAVFGVCVFAGLLLVWILWSVFAAGEKGPSYATSPLRRGDLVVSVSATGNLQPTNEVEVGSELSGMVSQVLVDNNDQVVQGQVLAVIDTARLKDAVREGEAALESAAASVAQAEASLAEADATLRRQEEVFRLSGGKAPAQTELDITRAAQRRASAALKAARAGYSQAAAALSSSRTQLGKATIRSPVTGVVLSRAVEPGQTVAASFNAPVLFTIAEDLSRMQLEVKVDEADVGQVRAGQRADFQVDAYPGRNFQAVVKRLDLGATTSSSTSGSGQVVAYTAVLVADNPNLALRPGMTGAARIIAAEKKGVYLAPNAALRFTPQAPKGGAGSSGRFSMMPRGSRSGQAQESVGIGRGSAQTLYVLTSEGKLRPIAVRTGDTNGSFTEVSGAGLKEGLAIVTGQLAGEGGARP